MLLLIRKYRVFASFALAALGALGMYFASPARVHYAPAVAILLCLACGIAAYFAVSALILHANTRLLLFSAVGGAAFALSLAVGTPVYENSSFPLSAGNLLLTALYWLMLFPALTALVAWFFSAIPQARERMAQGRLAHARMNPANWSGFAVFFAVWGVLLLFWLPAYLGYFPGIYGYDMHNQNHQALTHLYNAYQPLLHTLFYEGCYKLGRVLFHTGTGGVALYTAVQALLLSGCLAYVVSYLVKRLRVPFLITLASVAFYAWLPFHAILSVSSTKDAVFAGIFLLLLLQTFDLSREPNKFLHSGKRMALYVVTALIACLLRNNMLYALAFAAVVLVLGLRQARVRAALLLVAALAVSLLGGKALSGALDAAAGPRSELLNVPIQQLAEAYDKGGDAMTEPEKQTVYEYLPEASLAAYNPLLSDPVKFGANIGDGLPSILGFLKIWATELPGHLNDYVNSFLTMTLGYWYPDETLHAHVYDRYDEPDTEETLGYMYTGFMEDINPDVHKRSLWPAAERYYQWFAHSNGHQAVPVLSALMAPGLYCWLLFVTLLAMLYYGKMRLVWPLALPYGVWLTLLLGPCAIIRYAYPIIAAAPVLVGVLCNRTEPDALQTPENTAIGGGDSRGLEMLRFAIAGGVGFVIDYGCMVLFVKAFSLHYLLATALAFLLSVIVNYIMCAYWVFKGANTKDRGVQAGFIVTSLIGLGLNELIMLLLVDALHIHYAVSKLIAVVLVMIWNYISKRKVLVKNPKKTEDGECV